MDVGKIQTQSQLLQRDTKQRVLHTSVQENKTDTKKQRDDQTQREQKFHKEDIKKAVEGMNKFLEPVKTSIRFQYHEKLEEYYVTIVDSQTDQVVKEIPPKKMLDFYAAMEESLGIIVDHKI